MPALQSRLLVDGPDYLDNARAMLAKVSTVSAALRAGADREAAYGPRARDKGKLLPRERLGHLLDRGAPFLELCNLAGYQMYGDQDGSTAGGQLIAGIGFVSGRRIREGDLLVTSGLGGSFPPGYPVGVIAQVTRIPQGPFAQISARPSAALNQVREIMLIWSGEAPPPEEVDNE
jgi:hypothetical protein